MTIELAQAGFNGVVLGSMIALASLGMTLVWRIGGFPNVAQGDLLTLGAYFAFWLNVSSHLPLALAASVAVALTAIASVALYILVFRPLRTTSPVALLVASLGVALALRGVIGLKWGTELQAYRIPLMRSFIFHDVFVNPIDLYTVGAAVGLVIALYVFMYRTRLGTEVRAVADVPDLARVSGINSNRVLLVTWGAAGVVTGAAGVLLGAEISVTPLLGWNLLLPMFAATTLGGVGSLPGAILGGVVIGVATQVSTIWISSTYEVAIAFTILALVLLLRPRGLFAHA